MALALFWLKTAQPSGPLNLLFVKTWLSPVSAHAAHFAGSTCYRRRLLGCPEKDDAIGSEYCYFGRATAEHSYAIFYRPLARCCNGWENSAILQRNAFDRRATERRRTFEISWSMGFISGDPHASPPSSCIIMQYLPKVAVANIFLSWLSCRSDVSCPGDDRGLPWCSMHIHQRL